MMPEPKTAEEVLNALDHCITRDGDWDTIEEARKVVQDYARQQVEMWKEHAIIETQRQLNTEGPKDLFIVRQSWNAAVSHVATVLRALPVETP